MDIHSDQAFKASTRRDRPWPRRDIELCLRRAGLNGRRPSPIVTHRRPILFLVLINIQKSCADLKANARFPVASLSASLDGGGRIRSFRESIVAGPPAKNVQRSSRRLSM